MKTTTRLQNANRVSSDLSSDLESYRKDLAERTAIAENSIRLPRKSEQLDNYSSSKLIATYKQIQDEKKNDYPSLNNPNIRYSVKNLSIVSSLANPNKYVKNSSLIARYDSEFESLESANNYKGVILDAKI